MLWIERVEALSRVCWDYMTVLNQIDEEGHEYAQRIDNGDCDVDTGYLYVLDKRRASVRNDVFTITKLLHKEGITSIDAGDGLIRLTLKNGRRLTFETEDN